MTLTLQKRLGLEDGGAVSLEMFLQEYNSQDKFFHFLQLSSTFSYLAL